MELTNLSKCIARSGGGNLTGLGIPIYQGAANFRMMPLPGTAGSIITTTSRYGMWGNNSLGALGV